MVTVGDHFRNFDQEPIFRRHGFRILVLCVVPPTRENFRAPGSENHLQDDDTVAKFYSLLRRVSRYAWSERLLRGRASGWPSCPTVQSGIGCRLVGIDRPCAGKHDHDVVCRKTVSDRMARRPRVSESVGEIARSRPALDAHVGSLRRRSSELPACCFVSSAICGWIQR